MRPTEIPAAMKYQETGQQQVEKTAYQEAIDKAVTPGTYRTGRLIVTSLEGGKGTS